MTVMDNTVTTKQVVDGLTIDLVERFSEGISRLQELLGIFDVEILHAGTALMQLKITGKLNEAEVAEGDETPLSLYETEDILLGPIGVKPYRKLTTAQSILKSGFVKAVARTDNMMLNQVRNERFSDIVNYLSNGTTKASGETLQAALTYADTALDDQLETYGFNTEGKVHFVNRFDIADYLAGNAVTTQTLFGMTYLENYLGIEHVFVTSKVPKGTVYVTVVENLHIYGVDFEELKNAGIDYQVTDDGLIGVAHVPNLSRTACETFILTGMLLFAEIVDFIVVATIGKDDTNTPSDDKEPTQPTTPSGDTESESGTQQSSDNSAKSTFDPNSDTLPTMDNTTVQITAWAEAHNVELTGCTNKTQMLEAIAAAQTSNNGD